MVQSKVPSDLENLIARARAAPPEFAADALIRLAQSAKVPDPKLKRELLEDAFRLAAGAQHPVRRHAVGSAAVDTRAGYLSDSLDLGLDGLSLRGRAVEATLVLDKRRARELLGEMGPPRLAPLTCEDALVYQVSDFYLDTLRAVLNNSFSPEERRKGEHLRLLESHVAAMASPAQFYPLLELVLTLRLQPSELEGVVPVFTAALSRISGDDRSFSLLPGWPGADFEIFWTETQKRGLPLRPLLEAYRRYLVNHLSGARCADNKDLDPRAVETLNRLMERQGLSAFSTEERKAARLGGTAKRYPYWESREAKQILAKSRSLRNQPAAARQTTEWRLELDALLREMDAWSESQEASETDYFHQKCVLLEGLIDSVPAGPARDNLLKTFLSFVEQSGVQHRSRVEWYLHANYLIYKVRESKNAEVLSLLSHSRNPVLWLYEQLERFLQSPK